MIKLFSGSLSDLEMGEDVSIFNHWLEPSGAGHPRPREVIREVVKVVAKPDFVWVLPGSFCPPTYGHVRLVERAAEMFPNLQVVCSDDSEKKDRWFSMEECKNLWGSYHLPKNKNLNFLTLPEFMRKNVDPERIAIVRGIRNDSDWEREKQVAILNQKKFGITRYFYLLSEDGYENVSSSRVRAMAENMEIEALHRFVSTLVISALLEHVLKIKNLYLVVGKPGAGKSTFLEYLQDLDERNAWINSDKITLQLRSLLEDRYPGENLLKVVRERGEKIHEIIGRPWLESLKMELRSAAGKKNVFVEIPYGLEKNKQLFRFVGGKVIYLGCAESENQRRLISRGTPELSVFLEKIPGKAESQRIAKENKLSLISIDTGGPLEDLRRSAEQFNFKT
jgi:pantetheine-phosphate adenylyltransferase